MHERGIALSVIEAVIRNGLEGQPLRIHVTGGETEPAAFADALLAHLESDPRWTAPRTEVVRGESVARCSGCAREFTASGSTASCPDCGSPALPGHGGEQIEIEALPDHGGVSG